MKYVITGGPCTGKSTTLEALAKFGYEIVPEAARPIIEQEEKKPYGILPKTHLYEFQSLVYERQCANELNVVSDVAFLDRGKHDGIAYCREGSIEIPEFLWPKTKDYAGVFLLERLPVYVTDKQRKEDPKKAALLHELIHDAYKDCGYDVIRVPYFDLPEQEGVKKRVEFILEEVYRGSRKHC